MAHLLIHLPGLLAGMSAGTEFPGTAQRQKMPLWVALLIIFIAVALVAGVAYIFFG